jgi:hypothetical protein
VTSQPGDALVRNALLGDDLRDDDVAHAVRLALSSSRPRAADHSAPDRGLAWVRILHSLDAQLRSWRPTDHGGTT